MPRQRVRIRFSKQGRLKFIGHKDLLRTLEALFRRARLPLAMSSGFHPKVRMSFPSALALGYESLDEVLELEMSESAEPVDINILLANLNRHSLEGLTFLSARLLHEGEKKACLASSVFQMIIPGELIESTAKRIESFFAETSMIVSKSNGKSVDARSAVVQMVLDNTGELTIELRTQTGPEAGIKEVLKVLVLEKELFVSIFPKRIRCRLVDEEIHRKDDA
jgi:radical SAM-linked protein